MKYSVLAYRDIDLDKFNPPMLVPFSKEDAVDSVIDSCKKGKIPGAEAFELYFLGWYETSDARFELKDKPELVSVLRDYVRKDK